MVPSLVSNRGVDLGHSLRFPSEEHMVVVPVGGCDGAADRRLQGRGALKEADELNPMRVDGVAILHVKDEVLRDDGNWGMFMLAQIKLMATTMAGVCMTQMAKVNLHLVRFPGREGLGELRPATLGEKGLRDRCFSGIEEDWTVGSKTGAGGRQSKNCCSWNETTKKNGGGEVYGQQRIFSAHEMKEGQRGQ
ncbi:hypothetical protein NE237_026827 [Protea cynaroides]|uniref:Uncharacterized protein n=1 Tax=Protea cynaroides TaxID=273540 RepID=A0A9Q0GM85_9MAGN|nr:hypothetical protein NE237_026827 [Protea cynaroides]